ncbi:MAG: TetR/AcrR family transcriptional regulator [Solirubrobacterales bacterium]
MAGQGEPSPRRRMVEAAAWMLRSRSYAEASLRDIVAAADAPWGSLQHYFPGGKQQLAVEAIDLGRAEVGEFIEEAFARTRSAEGATSWFFDTSGRKLEETGYEYGCPVATVALERSTLADEVAAAAAAALEEWVDRFAAGFRADGIEGRAARRLATGVLSQYEGALLIARSSHSLAAMRTAKSLVRGMVEAAR